MLEFCYKCRGAVSVFLTLILIPTFIFSGVLVDGSRILGAKNLISGAGELAMNAALSDYHEELNKTYGLLAMAETAEEVDDIMQDFFQTTLNANGISEEDFSKALVYLELTNDEFSVSDIPGTEVYRTEVLKQEVLEYMKFRAPATLVKRAIKEKVEEADSLEEEKNAADGQLQFEKELDEMQKIFEDIKECTDVLEANYPKIYDETGFNKMLKNAKDTYKDKITVLAVSYYRMQNCMDAESGDTKGLMEKMVELADRMGDLNNINAATASCIIQMIMVENGMAGKDPDDVLEGLTIGSEEYEEMQGLIEEYADACEKCEEGITNTEKQLKKAVNGIYKDMNNQRRLLLEGKEKCEKLEDLIEDLKAEYDKLHTKYSNWSDAVGALPDTSGSKAGYQDNLEDNNFFDEGEGLIADFEDLLNKNKTYYEEAESQIHQITFTGKTLDEELTNYEDFINQADYGSIKSEDEIKQKASTFMKQYNDNGIETISLTYSKNEIHLPGNEFVKKVKEYCNNESEDKARAESETEKWNEEKSRSLEDLEKLLLSNDIDAINIKELGQGDLPTDWLNDISLEDHSDSGEVEYEGGLDNRNSREKVSGSGIDSINRDNDSLSTISGLAEKLAEGAETIVEPLYLTEYVMGMFSYYTSDKDTNGETVDNPLSISRDELNDNALYRAEIEYILWGSPDSRTNVTITKAILFTVNLIANLAFAFTNSTLKMDATEIAACFPVGPPAQVAIKCALQAMVAMVETTKNMVDLMDGKKVPLIKNNVAGGSPVWETPIINPVGQTNDGSTGWTYEDYLWVLVCGKMFIPPCQKNMLARTADCIELNMTNGKTSNDDSMKEMFTMIELEAAVSVDTFFLPKLSGAGYDVQEVDEETFTIKYYGVQGY